MERSERRVIPDESEGGHNMTRFRFGAGLVCAILALAVGRPAAGDDEKKRDAKPFDDATFVKKAAMGGMLEVELGMVAESKGSNDLVKKFGERMVKDHTQANKDLMTVAHAMNIMPADKLDAKHQKEVDKFNNLSGVEFDRKYMEAMVKDHEEDVAEFKRAEKEAKNQQLKEFATKTLPTLEEHLKHAKEVRDQIKK
jgi:putative membrane protein